MEQEKLNEILGITKCARCGHRLEGEIECPFCSLFHDSPRQHVLPKWVFLAACFLTSPLSFFAIVKSNRLTIFEKVIAFSGSFFWLSIYLLWF
jgi:hypothetical protein